VPKGDTVTSSVQRSARTTPPKSKYVFLLFMSANAKKCRSEDSKRFTKEELQILLDVYDDIMDIAEEKQTKAWKAWAAEVSNVVLFYQAIYHTS
jgi:hypothetical protein